jgi:hypothetical protein
MIDINEYWSYGHHNFQGLLELCRWVGKYGVYTTDFPRLWGSPLDQIPLSKMKEADRMGQENTIQDTYCVSVAD